ncbi:MAG TPA: arsenate reductase ArsC [Gemmatimonadales bacterium]|nr:arsenate reductase ArsC [Gemmatimonadales bacterium]
MTTVLFACTHNAGRSQMAAALFNLLADRSRAEATSAGTDPGEQVHPEVVAAMAELGVDLASAQPRYLTDEMARDSELLVTMGCDEACPVIPGLERMDWPLDDPKDRPLEEVRKIRDEIRRRVEALLAERGWAPGPAGA